MVNLADQSADQLQAVHPNFQLSARNLLHYLALRQHDRRALPSEAATSYELVRDLLRQGMDCMRINCAHDGEAAWTQMIAHLR